MESAFDIWFDQRNWSNEKRAKTQLKKAWELLAGEDIDDETIEDVFEKVVKAIEIDNGL